MSCKHVAALVLLTFGLPGCAWYSYGYRVVGHHDNGEVRQVRTGWHHDKWESGDLDFGYTSEYFENGKLSSEKWSHNGRLVRRLTFHDNARLKSEERLANGEVVYAAYYDEGGSLEKKVGTLPGSERHAAVKTPSQLASSKR